MLLSKPQFTRYSFECLSPQITFPLYVFSEMAAIMKEVHGLLSSLKGHICKIICDTNPVSNPLPFVARLLIEVWPLFPSFPQSEITAKFHICNLFLLKAQEDFSGNTTAHRKVLMTTIVSLCICLCLCRGVNQALRNIFIERDFNCQRINSVKTLLWLAFLSDWRSDIRSKRSDSARTPCP